MSGIAVHYDFVDRTRAWCSSFCPSCHSWQHGWRESRSSNADIGYEEWRHL